MLQNVEEQIKLVEVSLREAMLTSDVELLDQLLSPDLIFTNHLGHVLSKKDDLNAHASGLLKIENIEVLQQQVQVLNGAAVVSAKVDIKGLYDSSPANGLFRFTRVWHHVENERWQVVAGHSSIVA